MRSRTTASWISVARSPSTRGRVAVALAFTGASLGFDRTKLFRSMWTVRSRFILVKQKDVRPVCHDRAMSDAMAGREARRYPHGVPSWVDVTQVDLTAGSEFYGALF